MAKTKYVGLGITGAKYLTVYVDLEINGVNRPHEVKIPWYEFTREEVAYHINLATAQRLRAVWESEAPPWAEDLPLPGIG